MKLFLIAYTSDRSAENSDYIFIKKNVHDECCLKDYLFDCEKNKYTVYRKIYIKSLKNNLSCQN